MLVKKDMMCVENDSYHTWYAFDGEFLLSDFCIKNESKTSVEINKKPFMNGSILYTFVA